MGERLEWFDVKVTAGTLKSAPVETGIVFNAGEVERIDLTIPDGHAGLTGIRFNVAHNQVWPLTAGSYIIGNGVDRSWPAHGLPNGGNWSVTCFNTDIYDHTFHFAFLINELSAFTASPAAPLPPVVLGSGVALPAAGGLTLVSAQPAYPLG